LRLQSQNDDRWQGVSCRGTDDDHHDHPEVLGVQLAHEALVFGVPARIDVTVPLRRNTTVTLWHYGIVLLRHGATEQAWRALADGGLFGTYTSKLRIASGLTVYSASPSCQRFPTVPLSGQCHRW
jgi:hypothetical protein